ncbi:TPA: hypothetical protein LA460_000097 [Clostridium botulinum]|nr:hypothetical protein [Clostridium botulinum]HBJ1652702.1 hypothetical protein [Clostridium botulinum]
MGMYTGLRFKGVIKEKYREDIELMLEGENCWKDCKHEILKHYSKVSRSMFIPFGALAYMPNCWEDDKDGFEIYFNEETGLLCFQCSLKNYDSTIEIFLNNVASEIVEESIHIEVLYEEDKVSSLYKIKNGQLINFNYGIRYEDEDVEPCWFCETKLEKDKVNIYYEDFDFTKENCFR